MTKITIPAKTPEHAAAQGEPRTPMGIMAEELHLMKTAGIIEVAARNPSVMDFVEHWEGRALAAERHLAATETAYKMSMLRWDRMSDQLDVWRLACLAFAILAAVGVAT